jgi:hypothetical protein
MNLNPIQRIKNRIRAEINDVRTYIAVRDALIETARKLHLATTERADPHPTWTTGDGGRVSIRYMSNSHLFYAIAKAHRGEYPDQHARRTGVDALKREALRRLAKTVAGVKL